MTTSNNYCIIMGGGIGSRFWPFSREEKPKQFLDLLGLGHSLLQMTFDRFVRIMPKENIFVATNEAYADQVLEQLPISRHQLLLEPTRRNTAPCIAYATYHIMALNPEANIVVTPSDPLIMQDDIFCKNISTALDYVAERDILVTIGIQPTRPETGYGYIQICDTKDGEFHHVKTFTEKPNLELATLFMASSEFYWNAGIFVWRGSTIMNAFHQHMPEICTLFDEGKALFGTPQETEFIKEYFPRCPNISIDYGVIEKVHNIYMLPAEFGWSDLGTWRSLYELTDKDSEGNAATNPDVLLYNCKNNIVSHRKGRLCVVRGLEDYIIADDDDVLLICPIAEEQNIKQFIADAKLKHGDRYK